MSTTTPKRVLALCLTVPLVFFEASANEDSLKDGYSGKIAQNLIRQTEPPLQGQTVFPRSTPSPLQPGKDQPYSIRAWRAANDDGSDYLDAYPENTYPAIRNQTNTAFHCSGGGTRAFTTCVGAFRALRALKLPKPKYLLGISGGSWFTTVYSYVPESVASDDDLLGQFVANPEELSLKELEEPLPKEAMLSAPTRRVWWDILSDMFSNLNPFEHKSWRWVWQNVLYMVFLEPFGVTADAAFSFDSAGHNLPDTQYLDVRSNRPYPVIGTSLISLKDASHLWPLPLKDREYVMHEITPLYVGVDYARSVKYHTDIPHFERSVYLGGFMEVHGYGAPAPDSGIPEGQRAAVLNISKGSPNPFTLQRAIAHSSFAPGGWVHEVAPFFGDAIIDYMNYWSPQDTKVPPVQNEYLIADGGCTDNLMLVASIRRGVRRMVLWDSSSIPLKPAESWDPWSRPPRSDDISPDFSAFWGYWWPTRGQETAHNQFFEKSEFARVASGLQKAQDRGNGAVGTFKLTTIENKRWGLPAGIELVVTVYHLSRTLNWEKRLPYELSVEVLPDVGNATDPANVINRGKFQHFPFFNTFTQLSMTNEQAKILAHMTSYVVATNHVHFDLTTGAEHFNDDGSAKQVDPTRLRKDDSVKQEAGLENLGAETNPVYV